MQYICHLNKSHRISETAKVMLLFKYGNPSIYWVKNCKLFHLVYFHVNKTTLTGCITFLSNNSSCMAESELHLLCLSIDL